VPGHQERINFKAWGNYFAAKTVKQAALMPKILVFFLSFTFLLLLLPLSLLLPRKIN
jgi:hypothetical protein